MTRFAKRFTITTTILLMSILIKPAFGKPGWQLDLENGYASSGYNDVRYPGTTGTMVSLSRVLDLSGSLFYRVRVSCLFNERHTFSLLAAPLRLDGKGILPKDVTFGDAAFRAMTPVKTKYRFDSYRITYRYNIIRREKLRLGIGLTGKIRDAAISMEGNGVVSEKANTGFVPLINFRADIQLNRYFGFLIDGDALAAPQGRAEDVLAGITANTAKGVKLKLGYRILEGGADNDEVYTFAFINYFVLGVTWQF